MQQVLVPCISTAANQRHSAFTERRLIPPGDWNPNQ